MESTLPFASSTTAVSQMLTIMENTDTKCETIHAIRYIKPGDEITISYDKAGPFDSRRTYLK
jgi:hypothetical protein